MQKEAGLTRFRAKKYPQDEVFGPEHGIIIINEGITYSPVPAADFRVEKLCLDLVFRDLDKFISRMSNLEGNRVRQSWDKLRERLEKMPHRQKHLACTLCKPS